MPLRSGNTALRFLSRAESLASSLRGISSIQGEPEMRNEADSEYHDSPKAHEPHAVHEEYLKGPHDPKEINPKMASDIAYWSKELGVTGDRLMRRSAATELM